MSDHPLDKLRQLVGGERRYGVAAIRRKATTPSGYAPYYAACLCYLTQAGSWIKLRRLTAEELKAAGAMPPGENGYSNGPCKRVGIAPDEAAREAARRIAEATGLPIIEP